MNWHICTKENEQTILVAEEDTIPEGYVAEAITCNPNYLAELSPRSIPASEFRDRFTTQELAGILTAAYGGDINAQLLLLKVQTNTNGIELDTDETIQGIQYLQSIGVLTTDRAAVILG